MRNQILGAILSTGLLLGTVQPVAAATHYSDRSNYEYVKHKRHMKTAKRIGIGAGGGAVIGGLAGGGGGAVIGAAAGAGAGYLFDRHKKHHGHY
jgi:hypothetical protein